ncbi:hypothetical protein ANOM_011029 [Aspergillus nomiae NRRL 13137]|uniref:Heterokaryon incompatibility domain-containing protein n=1 Tax=Aspergillus nomiae NRRL (strain ATCC 15546 / NRRL 13137 / CBS 260.88 / M93) TaxID=1509407 RepID=A0A0L1IP21_ASPN3|nr:uncharacterized protein ANOM_011029 [Aspergillus nomiae NRRL 13137]KNG80943.1 hypothetical protein ANOM_011029 [Aspergillus nomiae NRRL 13137]
MPEPFEYSPLPGPTFTRLVSLVAQDDASRLPSQGEPLLQLSLCTVDLQDAPQYEALSYTWGSPFPQKDVRSRSYDEKNDKRQVLVNGRVHEIRRNLWEFLHQQQQANADIMEEAAEMLASGLDTYGRTPLMRAVIDRRFDLTEALLALGAEIGAQDRQGKTALHYAVPSNLNIELAELLVYHGADISARTREGKTPLDHAMDEVAALMKSVSKDLGRKPWPNGLRLSAQRPMWIDAISINQEDLAERNTQVALMSNIYSNAISVVVWLGVEDERIHLGLEPLERDPQPWLSYTSMRDVGLTGFGLGALARSDCDTKDILDILAIEKLMERTWWSRTWVIQELALAKRTLFVCGSITTQHIKTAFLLLLLCYLPSPGVPRQNMISITDIMAIFESVRLSGVHGIEALMLANICCRSSAYAGVRELLLKSLLKQRDKAPSISWGQGLSLQNLVRLSWWSQASDPRDKVFALLGIACPDPQGQRITVDYKMSTVDVFVQFGHVFMQGSTDRILDLYAGDYYVFEPLEGLSYVQDAPDPHPRFQDYKSQLPSWTPNFSAHPATCRIWSQRFSAASDISNSSPILPHSDPRVLCVTGHMVDDIVATVPKLGKGDAHEPEILAWLELIQPLNPNYLGGGSCVDALWQTLTVGKESENKKATRKDFRRFLAGKLYQSPMNPRLQKVLTPLRKSRARETLPSYQELLVEEQELDKLKKRLLVILEGRQKTVEGDQEKEQRLMKLVQEVQEQGRSVQEQRKWLRKRVQESLELVQGLQERWQGPVELELELAQEHLKLLAEGLQVRAVNFRPLGSFSTLLKWYYRSRCLFRTRQGYIGLGPAGVQPGDEVWLFATARTPFVLRQPSQGSLGRQTRSSTSSTPEGEFRTFIGETYVHGIMNGEAMREGDFRPVLLV